METSVLSELVKCTSNGITDRVCIARIHPELNNDLNVCFAKNNEDVTACMAEAKALASAIALTERQFFERAISVKIQALNL